MTIFMGNGRAKALTAFGVSVISMGLMFAGADSAAAAKKTQQGVPGAPQSEAEQQKSNAAATRQAYDNGIKSYSSGKYQPAVDLLTTAVRGGGLSSAEMAKALYMRGLAYKKLSKPGLAISDLTSALWLKNGLGEADQKSAIAERADAYRAAGLGDGNSGGESVSVADPNPVPAGAKASAPSISPAAAVPAAPAVVHAAANAAGPAVPAPVPQGEITRQSPDSEAARDAANARRLAAAPVDAGGLQAAAVSSFVSDQARADELATTSVASTAPPAAVAAASPSLTAPLSMPEPAAAAPVLSAAPIEDTAPTSVSTGGSNSGGLSSVTGFFSNLFGGGNSAAPPAATSASPVTTASTSPAAATSSWADTTSVASGNSKKAAPAKVAQASAAAPALSSGKYKLHIAAVRSRAEAEALAQKLATQQGAALKSRIPVVDEAVIGSMGTFYRVRVGSFANAEEPRGVCNTLRSSGFDCLVVTN